MPTEPELVGEGEESLETAQSSDTALSAVVPEEPSNARLALILGCMWVSGPGGYGLSPILNKFSILGWCCSHSDWYVHQPQRSLETGTGKF
jgi:hypothetical protein